MTTYSPAVLKAEEAITKIFENANALGIEFIVFGGWRSNSLDMSSSDVDLFFKNEEELNLFSQLALKELGNHVVALRRVKGGIHLVFRFEKDVFMLDMCSGLHLEHLTYVDSKIVFALKEMGCNVENLLRSLKHLTAAKAYRPFLPPKIYFLSGRKVNWKDHFLYWSIKVRKRIFSYAEAKTGIMVVLLGPDGSGKSTLAMQVQTAFDGKRNIIPTLTFHWVPPLRLSEKPKTVSTPVKPYSLPPRGAFLSAIKLGYLFIRFWLGFFVNIRPLLSRTGVIVGDRYYDDLFLDPIRYRYAGSRKLARWLRRFIPRPDIFLVLDVPIEKLLERKQEVKPKELHRQVKAYRAFAVETPNAYLLDGSLSPAEVTREAQWIILDHLRARYISRRHVWFPKAQTEKLGWLSQALDITITYDYPTHAWLRLPDGRGYLLPLANKEVFRRGLELYPAQGRKARLGKKMLGSLAGLGLKAPGLTKLNLQEQAGSVTQTLRSFFGEKNLHFAVSLGTPSPHRKPVLQVLTPAGEVLGYAKVGWNDPTRALVKHEAQILNRLSREEELPFDVPKVLHAHNHGERMLCVQSPPPNGHRPAPHSQHQVYIDTLCALASMGNVQRPLEASGFWQNIRARTEKVRHPYWKRILQESMEKVRQEWEGEEVPFHMAHGDFAPWNAFLVGERLYLYDWEYAMEESPAGYDLFHFEIQTFRLVEKRSPQEICSLIVQPVGHSNFKRYWDIIGATPSVQRLLLKLYLLERLSFHCLIETTTNHQRRLFQHLLQQR